jgi:LysM repeat protein
VRLKIYPGGLGAPRPTTVVAAKKPAPAAPSRSAAASQASRTTQTASASGGGGSAVVHRVQRGETLWSIARAYRTTVETLRGANPFLLNRGLQAGDSLRVSPAN